MKLIIFGVQTGDVDIYWEGFLVADTYREQFISTPYVLHINGN